MKLTYTPATLTAEHLPTYIRARSSPDITRAARHALEALESFLGDRLRDTAALGDDLLAELRERAAAIPLRATMTDPEDAARRAKIVKDADARDRLIARLTGTQQHAQPSAQA